MLAVGIRHHAVAQWHFGSLGGKAGALIVYRTTDQRRS
jgi:hypothetical protein